MGEFALQLGEFVRKVSENADQVVRKVAIDAASSVIMATPVGDPDLWKRKAPPGYVGGRLRANWNIGLGAMDTSTTTAIDQSGSATTARATAKLAGASATQDVYITNSLPYAIPVEYGQSKQAPAGMVRVTVTQWQTFVDNAARSLP